MERHYYKSGDTPFYTVTDSAGKMVEAWHFDAGSGELVADFAAVTRRLYIAPEETESLDETAFNALLDKRRGAA
jgi:hypothetical protein